MAKIGLIRCEKNEKTCPLTSCLKCIEGGSEAFSIHGPSEIMGIFTCRCPGDNISDMAKILKSKGAEAIHFCTCTFSHKKDGNWVKNGGFCPDIEALIRKAAEDSGLRCFMGSAHLPEGYETEIFGI